MKVDHSKKNKLPPKNAGGSRLVQYAAVGLSLLLFLALFFYARQGRSVYDRDGAGITYETARVLSVLADNTEEDPETENVLRGSQELELEILTGRYAGETVQVTNYLSAFYNVIAREGMKLAVSINTIEEGVYSVSVYNYSRDLWIWAFGALFALALFAVGGKQGLKALAGLGVTVFCVLFLLVPLLVQRGWPPIPTTLAIVAYTSFVTFIILGGVQVKTMAAALGSFGGVLLAGGLAWAACKIVHISGMNMDEAESLLLTAVDNGLKIRGLYICGILIASEGAVMDIAMSISSAVAELHAVNPSLTPAQLFRSGMNIGRDAMGTMANTLVLAFAGTSLNMMIFIYAYDVSYIQLLNTDFVAIEVIRSLAGSIGIILTVPVVAAVSAWLL
ncbi:YibE/F family protein [uncultured Oscillibacter sp.]|uniref:YibE/F family protein n=1 Tax=uncultured Oscillibacter sp. TaxID=876091 RepID=UPI0025DED81A|nr:YibE/F family protein [uncultured Oscillibacter sp.]